MSADYIRLCPTCGSENAPETMRCACGALLAGIDLSARVALPATPAETVPAAAPAEAGPVCPHADCGQANPPGSTRCLYCDRPLDSTDPGLSGQAPGIPTLLSLPGALAAGYRIERALPATGAEAELLVVVPLAGGAERIAKIYRHGIHPDREVQARLARVDPRHRVELIAAGLSDGYAYELMEYCRAGSLRDLLRGGAPGPARLRAIIGELADAIAAVHEAGLIHRDLKPENILIRSQEPLDLVLTDFGIASLHDATLRFTGVARTLAYGAPETLSGVIDDKADWWSLGMIVLEAALGAHPFAGLSDAVILLRLTTRGMDLSGIPDPDLKKLLRGLLRRDPKLRWGAGEITRWLDHDPQLPEPADEESQPQARSPYQIGKEQCFTPDQLAVALARHWPEAVSDLDNGLLMKWFRESLRDQNRVRFLIDLNLERQLHVDVRLLRLIIDLAPGIPPVWRGESLALREILKRADGALKNRQEDQQWLDALYEHRVLEAYAAAGNPQVADIVSRWHGALDHFNAAWKRTVDLVLAAGKASRNGAVLYDDVLYGDSGPLRPSPRQLHARLLALAYDEGWAARLRQYLATEIPRLAVACPWLLAVGDIASLPGPDLLALECLLPEARKRAKQAAELEQLNEEDARATTRRLQVDANMLIGEIQRAADSILFSDTEAAALRETLARFFGLSAQIRAMGRTDAEHQRLRNLVARAEPFASRIERLVERIVERRAVNRGWFNQQTLGFVALAMFLLPLVTRPSVFYLLLWGALGVALWRFLPNYFSRREMRALAARLGQH